MNILQRLYELQDREYQAFQARLVPTISPDSIIGVRVPLLRKLAKELYNDPAKEEFMKSLPHDFYEENQLHIMLVCMEKDFDKCIDGLDTFLPFADNWAVTDQPSPKCFKKNHEKLLTIVPRWIKSGHTYTMRYALNIYMHEFLDDDYDVAYPEMISKIRGEDYYLKMMIAWYFATALAKQYDTILPFIENHMLDPWTHNKAIQKAIESYRITKEQKDYLRTLKITRS